LNLITSSFAQVVLSTKEHDQSDKMDYHVSNENSKIIDPAEALVSFLAFVRHSLPDPTIVEYLAPETFTSVTSLKGNGGIQFPDVPFALSPIEARQAYVQKENGELQLVWDLQLELEDNWYNGHINAHDGTVLSMVDWVSSAAAYNVIPFGSNDPNDSERKLLKDPHDTWASPDGWHSQGVVSKGAKTFNVTIGNNAYTHTNPDGGSKWHSNYRPSGEIDNNGDIVFDFDADFESQEPKDYEDAAVTNLFYWVNTAHDFFYRYGFDEKSGNFQQDNLGRGREGKDGEGDAVIANAQDGSGVLFTTISPS
jgi:extracellular elastinolytic metalloproteinase